MAQIYSDPKRADDPHALPNIEVFYDDADTGPYSDEPRNFDGNGEPVKAGWYWQPCFPGCLPDGDPIGPFPTEAEAIADAQGEG
jgi:hypothetical protein